jgi:uncharacterized membrane protein
VSTTTTVSLLWAGFIGTHLALASMRVEPRLRARIGDQPFLGLYSLVAFAFFVPLCWVYFGNRHDGEWLWVIPLGAGLRAALYAAMTLALGIVIAGAVRPSPASLAPGDARVVGVARITRHPVALGTAMLMALHALPNGNTADLAFFGGFVVLGVAGAWHQDRRKLHAGSAEFRDYHAATPFWPFTGPGALRGLAETPWWVWAIALAAMLGIRWLHPTGIWPG